MARKEPSGLTSTATHADIKFHSGQHAAWQSKARTVCIVAGRRWGKSEYGVWWSATKARKLAELGRNAVGWYVVPTYRVGRPSWRKYLELLPKGWLTKVNGTERAPDSLEFGPRSKIEFKSADIPENLVAEGLDFVWIDEAGIIEESVWRESIRPALIDRQAPALLTGTPKAKNWFHRMYARGIDPEYPNIETFGGPTFENPWLNEDEFQELVQDMPPHLIQQEIFGDFLEDAGDVFRNIDTARNTAIELFPPDGFCNHDTFCIGVDLARLIDFTVLFGVCREGHPTAFERFQKKRWGEQKAIIKAAAEEHGAILVVDASGIGDVVVQDLQDVYEKVLPVKTGPNKAQLVDALSIALDQLKILIPDEPVITAELKAFGYELTPHGNIRYKAPDGMHDDCVIAMALAAYGLINAPPSARLWGF